MAPRADRSRSSGSSHNPQLFSESSDFALVQAYRRGNQAALDALMLRYHQFVRLKASSYFLAGGDAEDLIQEGMLGLYKAVRDYRDDQAIRSVWRAGERVLVCIGPDPLASRLIRAGKRLATALHSRAPFGHAGRLAVGALAETVTFWGRFHSSGSKVTLDGWTVENSSAARKTVTVAKGIEVRRTSKTFPSSASP